MPELYSTGSGQYSTFDTGGSTSIAPYASGSRFAHMPQARSMFMAADHPLTWPSSFRAKSLVIQEALQSPEGATFRHAIGAPNIVQRVLGFGNAMVLRTKRTFEAFGQQAEAVALVSRGSETWGLYRSTRTGGPAQMLLQTDQSGTIRKARIAPPDYQIPAVVPPYPRRNAPAAQPSQPLPSLPPGEEVVRFGDGTSQTYFDRLSAFSAGYGHSFKVKGVTFTSLLQYVMVCKAQLAGDHPRAGMILAENDPAQLYALAYRIPGLMPDTWNAKKESIWYDGARALFSENRRLRAKLLATDGQIIERGSPDNLLGKTLMRLRDELKEHRWPPRPSGEIPTAVRPETLPDRTVVMSFADEGAFSATQMQRFFVWGQEFGSLLQCVIYQKAMLAGKPGIAVHVLDVIDPIELTRIGDSIPIDSRAWQAQCDKAWEEACNGLFIEYPELIYQLKTVPGDLYDREGRDNNALGKALTRLRALLDAPFGG